MTVATELAPTVGAVVACLSIGVSRAGYYRRQSPPRPFGSRLFCDFSAVLTSIQEQFQFTIGKPRGMN